MQKMFAETYVSQVLGGFVLGSFIPKGFILEALISWGIDP